AFFKDAARVVRNTAILDEPERFRRHRRQPSFVAGAQVTNVALREVDLDLVALRHMLIDAWRNDDRQSDIDAVARVDSPEARRDDRTDASLLHRRRCFLAARSADEILATNNHVATFDLLWELFVDSHHEMACHLARFVGRPEPHLRIN